MKGRVCQLFEVFQHEFANLSLPCEGRLRLELTKAVSLQYSGTAVCSNRCWNVFQNIYNSM